MISSKINTIKQPFFCKFDQYSSFFSNLLIFKFTEIMLHYQELGKYYEVPVKFLNIDLALPSLSVGKKITLWEGKEVANGEIRRIEKKP